MSVSPISPPVTRYRSFRHFLAETVSRSTSTGRGAWLLTFGVLFPIYLLCGHRTYLSVNDGQAAAWPAWAFAHLGTFHLEHVHPLPHNVWFSHSHGHVVSNRTVGVILVGVPAAFLMHSAHQMAPAVLTASLVTAMAGANLALLFRRLVAPGRLALSSGIALGLGTGFWTVAGSELWTHGPDALWLSFALLALSSSRLWLAGGAMGPAILTRPHLAVVAALLGLALAWAHRSWRPMLAFGAPGAAGILLVLLWNKWLFGHATLGGGAYSYAAERLTTAGTHQGSSPLLNFASSTLTTLAGSLVSPSRGLLTYSPFLLVGVIALARKWRSVPTWTQLSLIAGVAYALVQSRINGFGGGYGYYSNRLMLETLVLSVPAGVIAYSLWVQEFPIWRTVTRVLVGLSIGSHAIGALFYAVPFQFGQHLDLWRTWVPGVLATSMGVGSVLISLAFCSVAVAVCLIRLPRDPGVGQRVGHPEAIMASTAP